MGLDEEEEEEEQLRALFYVDDVVVARGPPPQLPASPRRNYPMDDIVDGETEAAYWARRAKEATLEAGVDHLVQWHDRMAATSTPEEMSRYWDRIKRFAGQIEFEAFPEWWD